MTGPSVAQSGRTGASARRFALAMGVALAVFGAWNWALRPDEPIRWLRGMLLVPGAWCALALYRRLVVRSVHDHDGADRAAVSRYFDSAMALVVAAGCPILVGYGLGIWTRLVGPIGPEAGRRILAVSVGVMFVVTGNIVPKILTPLVMLPPGRAGRQQQARRFFGLITVLLGLTLTASAVLAPLDVVFAVRRLAMVVGGLAVLAAIVWMNAAPSQPEGQA